MSRRCSLHDAPRAAGSVSAPRQRGEAVLVAHEQGQQCLKARRYGRGEHARGLNEAINDSGIFVTSLSYVELVDTKSPTMELFLHWHMTIHPSLMSETFRAEVLKGFPEIRLDFQHRPRERLSAAFGAQNPRNRPIRPRPLGPTLIPPACEPSHPRRRMPGNQGSPESRSCALWMRKPSWPAFP
jgi:hypothetical protein